MPVDWRAMEPVAALAPAVVAVKETATLPVAPPARAVKPVKPAPVATALSSSV